MDKINKSYKEILINKLTLEGKVKDIKPSIYSKSVNNVREDMKEVINEFKILDLKSKMSASEVVLNY